MELTKKEELALMAITNESLDGMGGTIPYDLHNDNYSWHNASILTERLGINKQEAGGIMSALEKKGLTAEHDPTEMFGWVLTSRGIDQAQAIHEGVDVDELTIHSSKWAK